MVGAGSCGDLHRYSGLQVVAATGVVSVLVPQRLHDRGGTVCPARGLTVTTMISRRFCKASAKAPGIVAFSI
jgi:hypothetical protein